MVKIKNLDVIVIGAGQAGLSMSYYLKQENIRHIVVDAHDQVGDSWRKRYDSLVLFTPRSYSSLPQLDLEGNPVEYPSKDDVANYLSIYAEKFDLPIKMNTEVISIKEQSNQKIVITSQATYHAKIVVVATGPFQTPFVPKMAKNLDSNVYQVHSSKYKNPSELNRGTTLIVGAGNSGLQIATEIAKHKKVYVSEGRKRKVLPKKILNKSIFWWFEKLKISDVSNDSKIGQLIRNNDPIIGKEHRKYVKSGQIIQKKRLDKIQGNNVIFENKESLEIDNVIWCTGFCFDYSWINISGVVSNSGQPKHKRGISPVKGLYFLGLSWQHTRGSALLLGVSKDAKYLIDKIKKDLLAVI